MKSHFVKTSNVNRALAACAGSEARAVAEHVLCVWHGPAGLGKSKTGMWWSNQRHGAMIRVHPGATPTWVLRDLAFELGVAALPKEKSSEERAVGRPRLGTTEALHSLVVGALAADPRLVVVDEAQHALERDLPVLDTLREIADLCEVPVILVGREGTLDQLRRHRQIYRRIGGVAKFELLELEDVALLASELCDPVPPERVLVAVLKASEGLIDGALRGLARAEAIMKRGGKEVDLAQLGHPGGPAQSMSSILRAAARAKRPEPDQAAPKRAAS